MANIPFPNEKIDLGVQEPFIRDLQNALNVAETGVYDFLTMCHVIVHKFRHGLNFHDPTVGAETWNSIMEKAHGVSPDQAANRAAAGGGANDREREGVATIGQINRDTDTAPDTARATTTGTTNATDETLPPIAQPDTNPDRPRPDQPTVTAAEQQAAGGNAGGYTAAPTDHAANAPSPAEQNAGVQSTQQEREGGTATP